MQWKVPRGVTRVKSSSGCLTRFLVRIPLIILSLSLLSTAYRNPKTKAWNLQVPRSCDGGLICDAHCSLERQGKRNEFSLFAMVAGVNQARRLDRLPSCWNSDLHLHTTDEAFRRTFLARHPPAHQRNRLLPVIRHQTPCGLKVCWKSGMNLVRRVSEKRPATPPL